MISGRLVVITGGSSGIGKQLALDLLQGNNTVVVASNNLEKMELAIRDFLKVSQNAHGYHVDVGDLNSIEKFAAKVLHDHGCPDVLVNNAGYATYQTFEETNIIEIGNLVNVNLLGAMRCAHFFLPKMIERRQGIIVNVASVAGKMIITPNSVYGASKHGMVAWSDALRMELSRFNIHVSVICPGRVKTDFFDHDTFKSRIARAETQLTVPVETVSREIISAIEWKKSMVYIPKYYGVLVWVLNAFGFIFGRIYNKILRSRIEELYLSRK